MINYFRGIIMTDIQSFLFSNQDLKYRDFNIKLVPDIPAGKVVGVRSPVLRAKAKQMVKSGEAVKFIKKLPHKYQEENILHAYIISEIADMQTVFAEVERFLPYIDNWAVCDVIRPKPFKKGGNELLSRIKLWLKSDETYTVRFGIVMLMTYYLDDGFEKSQALWVAASDSDEYYISMAVAWYFATALAKQYDSVLPVITSKKLSAPTHNRAIRKAAESLRISEQKKTYLKTLIIKK